MYQHVGVVHSYTLGILASYHMNGFLAGMFRRVNSSTESVMASTWVGELPVQMMK